MTRIDPVTAAVIQGGLDTIALEMGHKLMRMSYSSIIRESEDFGAALTDATGRQLCECRLSTPLQSGPIPGYRAFLSDQGLPYDILVDVDVALLRVQVKSTRKPKNHDPRTRATPGYFFHLRRAGKGGRRRYPENAFDLYALVALDRQAIAYLPAVDCSNQTIALRVPGERYLQNGSMNREFQEASFRHALSRLGFEA